MHRLPRALLITCCAGLTLTPIHAQELVGEGDWQFKVRTDVIALPDEHQDAVQDYHGIAIDRSGRVYVGYYSATTDDHTRTVARYHYRPDQNPPFQFDQFLGTKDWVTGRLHGLNIIETPDGEERLLLVYNKQRTIVCDLDGNIEDGTGFMTNLKPLKKGSDGHRAPQAEVIGVLDGYKSNKFLGVDWHGHLHSHTTGDKGTGDGHTNTAHGIGLDPAGHYVIADRGNQRLTWWDANRDPLLIDTPNGTQQKQLAMPGLEVCNVAFTGDVAIVPCLNARLAIIGPDPSQPSGYRTLATLVMPPLLVKQGYDGIHDANFTHDRKYIIIGVWQRRKDTPPRLFALERVEAARLK